MKGKGKLTLRLQYDKMYVRRISLWIPSLSLNKDIGEFEKFENIPIGHHKATLVIYTSKGNSVRQNIMLDVQEGKENLHFFDLYDLPQEVVIRPVDAKDKAVPNVELKIEGVDPNFRPVRQESGIAYTLHPGQYEVKVLLPNCEVKSIPLTITEDHHVYAIPVEEKPEHRQEPRIEISVPAGYRTKDRIWHASRSINISSNGVCLVKDPDTPNQMELQVRLILPHSSKVVECGAQVKWNRKKPDGEQQMGLELMVDEVQRNDLRKWLEETLQQRSVAHNFLRR